MFENKIIKGEYATRYIASWLRVGGNLRYGKDVDNFQEWLSSIGLTEEEIYHITELARCGKLELQTSAKSFLTKDH